MQIRAILTSVISADWSNWATGLGGIGGTTYMCDVRRVTFDLVLGPHIDTWLSQYYASSIQESQLW